MESERSVGEGLSALPSDGDNISDGRFSNYGQVEAIGSTRPVTTKIWIIILLFALTLTACTDKPEPQAISAQQPEIAEEVSEPEEEFPIPELSNDNIKDVNAVLMEHMRQGMIDASGQESLSSEEVKMIEVTGVDQPKIEIEVAPPVFELESSE